MSMTSGPTEPWRTGKPWLLPPLPSAPRVSVACPSAILFCSVHPVRDAGEAFLAPQQDQNIEYAGRGRPPGERGAQRLRHLAELDPGRFRCAAHRRLCGERRPLVKRIECTPGAGEQAGSVAGQQLGRLVLDIEGARPEEKCRILSQFIEVLRPGLELRHGPDEKLDLGGGEVAADQRRDPRSDQVGEAAVIGLANIMAVQILEFADVEARRRLADMVEIEPANGVLLADDLVVAMAPAQAQDRQSV